MELKMSESIEVSRIVPASAEAIYKAWLSASEHGQMTGSPATYNDADDTFTAWEGYISGKTLEKQPFSRIVQAWRTTEFLETDPDSTLEILLDPQGDGTMVTLRQSNIPIGQADGYRSGWEEHYFAPMIAYSHSARAKLNQAGHAISEAAESVQKSANQAARSVRKTAKKATRAVKKFVAKAKKRLAARKPKAKPSPKKAKRKTGPKKAKARMKRPASKKPNAPRKKAAAKKGGKKRSR
jgi:uncharacterized protein YndB with AHSA1/START domain